MSSDQDPQLTPPEFVDENMESVFDPVMSPSTINISLADEFADDDDENPFSEQQMAREKTATTTNVVDVTPEQVNQTVASETKVNDVDESENSVESLVASNQISSPSAENVPTLAPDDFSPFKNETSALDIKPKLTETTSSANKFPASSSPSTSPKKSLGEIQIASESSCKRSSERDIFITVHDPSKVGDGISSYMSYRITTKTTSPMFKSSEFSVNRRFSDFLGLHVKLVSKYLHTGLLLPSPPEKDSLSMAKVKMSKEETVPSNFLDRRRSLLERYLNRLAQHPKLLEDLNMREFIESPQELPKSTNTQALSGAGVLRAFSSISGQMAKLTTKTSEQDQWFEEKHSSMMEIQKRFKSLYHQLSTLFSQRKEAAYVLKQFSVVLNHLAGTEEHALVSNALVELANLEEKLDQTKSDYMMREYSTLTEVAKEYISLLDMVELTFHERINTHHIWLNAEETLKRKRETKTKLEQTPKSANKLPQAEMEIHEWEGKVVKAKQDFEQISTNLRYEIDVFEDTRIEDFKQAIQQYLQHQLEQQERILQLWEAFLPEANKIDN